MPATVAFPALALAALCSAALMWAGVSDQNFSATAWGAAAFAVIAVLAGWHLNRPHWSRHDGGDVPARQLRALRRTGQVSAIVYVWGALALVAMYKLTGLYWQHAIQYACGMLLFAAIIYGWSRRAAPGGPYATPAWGARAAKLNLLHGAAAAVAAAIFLFSGKFWVPRPDWAANIVFLSGGFSIIALCTLAAITHARIARAA